MAANFFLVFIEVAYLILQRPEELPVYMRRIPYFRRIVIVILVFSALATSCGLYIARNSYESAFFVQIFVLALLQVATAALWALILGGVIDALVRLRHPDRISQTWTMVSIIIVSALPFCFIPAGAIPARLFPRPTLLLIPLGLLLFFWSGYIVVRGLQFLYELPIREAVLVFARAVFFALAFPVVVVFLVLLGIWHLAS